MKKQNPAAACFVFSVFLFVLESNLSIISKFNVPHSTRNPAISTIADRKGLELKSISNWDHLPPPTLKSPQPQAEAQIMCDRSHHNYDICTVNGPTILDPRSSIFYLVDPSTSTPPSLVEKIRPYPRKWENFTMGRIKELTITSASGPIGSQCQVHHNVPALVFSLGAYTGNFWHEFNDGFIPLFITVNTVFPDQDFVLVISKARDWWISKYADLLRAFSKHPIVNLDNDNTTHCFTSTTLGLISHGFMTIDPTLIPNSRSFSHFRALLHKAYGHGRKQLSKHNSPGARRPRLVLASRGGGVGRVILNQAEVKRAAEEIGFDVTIFEPTPRTPLHQAYELVNSSHAMIGVHGAALTHSLFLRPGSVFVQAVPLGLEWVAKMCFANSARPMGLHYMEYKINADESSLVEKYDKNELLIKDPVAYRGGNWSDAIMNIYLKEQNVKFDLVRFKKYLKEVYRKAKQFMDKEG